MPAYYDKGKQIQIFVSEYALNTALHALHDINGLSLELDIVTAT